jgi:hypothetical protein
MHVSSKFALRKPEGGVLQWFPVGVIFPCLQIDACAFTVMFINLLQKGLIYPAIRSWWSSIYSKCMLQQWIQRSSSIPHDYCFSATSKVTDHLLPYYEEEGFPTWRAWLMTKQANDNLVKLWAGWMSNFVVLLLL